MTKLLQINSSVFSDQGVSSQLADAFVAEFRRQDPQTQVIRRDLASEPVPHLDGERLNALMTPESDRSATQQNLVRQADDLIREIQDADVLVLGAPMYNFAVPSQLKSWFDMIARAGTTFRYTEEGSEGLLQGKRAYVFTSRGGVHREQPSDTIVPFLRQMLSLVGIDQVEFVYAEGLNMGQEPREQGMNEARRQIDQLLVA
ncbi:MAG: FMN-dependent NADH-azoreductase [Ectothiorhodospiraceae bacterium]|nr:FMN-dependent NADH-azoreductase [Ectothiorhodospiraceae bacterium]MCH8504618.1 FMN-dependent NADH-azoreductase [Ectothiorhodospiraceae bacterium]